MSNTHRKKRDKHRHLKHRVGETLGIRQIREQRTNGALHVFLRERDAVVQVRQGVACGLDDGRVLRQQRTNKEPCGRVSDSCVCVVVKWREGSKG